MSPRLKFVEKVNILVNGFGISVMLIHGFGTDMGLFRCGLLVSRSLQTGITNPTLWARHPLSNPIMALPSRSVQPVVDTIVI